MSNNASKRGLALGRFLRHRRTEMRQGTSVDAYAPSNSRQRTWRNSPPHLPDARLHVDTIGTTSSTMPTDHDRQVDYVEFGATDLGRIKQFYQQVFDWRFEDYGPDYMSFQDGRLSGGFAKASAVRPGGPLVVIYAIRLEDVEAKVKQAGGKIVKPTFSFPGGRRFHFTDPSGNELAVWTDR